jgi:HAD superfamily hydrolase (TIGR01509 family)
MEAMWAGETCIQAGMIRAAIFDVDGTLIDSVDAHARAWQLALEHFGHSVNFEEVRHQIGKGGDQLLPVFLSEQELKERGEELENFRGELFKNHFMDSIQPFPKVRELFLKLRSREIRAVLASSAKADELEYYKRLCRIEDLVEGNTSSDDADRSKPYPDIFQAALAKIEGVEAEDAIVIGDTPYDIIAAKRAGIESIGMLCGGFPEDELWDAGCIAIYESPADLLAKFERSPLMQGTERLRKMA